MTADRMGGGYGSGGDDGGDSVGDGYDGACIFGSRLLDYLKGVKEGGLASRLFE